jgi:hypothetical protein
LKTVVLPAPFGPISAVMSPAADIEGDVADRDQAAEAHGEVLDGEDRIGVPVPARRGGHQWPSPWATRSAPMRFFSFSIADGLRLETRPAAPDHDDHHDQAEDQHPVLDRDRSCAERRLKQRHILQVSERLRAADHDDGGKHDADLRAEPPSSTMARMIAIPER